jgi:polyphenol oxidase
MSLRRATVASLAAIPGLVHGFDRRVATAVLETRDETRARVAEALGAHGQLWLLRQVHGTTVVEPPWLESPEADAAVTSAPGQLLGIETADCLPVLFVDPRRRAVGAAHAGWRGTAAQVVRRVVEALAAGGSEPGDLLLALGPAIGPCCYEVGDELRERFGEDAPGVFVPGRNGRVHLDLRAANVRQLRRAGIGEASIAHVDECTRCHPERYHSFRRDGLGSGRMISFVGFSR